MKRWRKQLEKRATPWLYLAVAISIYLMRVASNGMQGYSFGLSVATTASAAVLGIVTFMAACIFLYDDDIEDEVDLFLEGIEHYEQKMSADNRRLTFEDE